MNANLVNISGDKPKLIKREDNKLVYTIPSGLTFTDFVKEKEAIEHVIKNHVIMKNDNNMLVIETLS